MTKPEKEMQAEELERQMMQLFNNFCVVVVATLDGKEVQVAYWNNARAETEFNLLKSRRDSLKVQ